MNWDALAFAFGATIMTIVVVSALIWVGWTITLAYSLYPVITIVVLTTAVTLFVIFYILALMEN